MELHVVVITFATEVDESLASFGNDVCVEFQIDHSKIGHKPHVTFLLHPKQHGQNCFSFKPGLASKCIFIPVGKF